MAALRFDLRARSRESLRRGLLLSGILHVTLLFAFLTLRGSGDPVIRLNRTPVDLFRLPAPKLLPPPPAEPRALPPIVDGPGIFDPAPIDPREMAPRVDARTLFDEGPAGDPGPGRDAGEQGPPEGPSNPPPGDRVYFSGDVEAPPVAIEAPKPPYPPIAREYGITGRVDAQVLVKPDGTVAKVQIRSGNRILSESVEQTLYRWRFQPGRMGGRPVSVWVEIPVVFTL